MKFPRIYASLFSVGLMVVTTHSFAQPTAVAPASAPVGPKLVPIQGDYNFGKVMEGTLVKHTFIVSNAGDQMLDISSVVPGCHCTTAGDWSHHIEPGKTGTIAIQLNSAGMRADVTRTVAVSSNDKLAPRQTLFLRGSVWKEVEVSPQFAYLTVMPDASSNTSTIVHITDQSEKPMELSDPTSSNPAFTVSLKAVKPGKEFELTVTAQGPLNPGNNSGTVSVKSTLTNMPIINITTVAMVQPSITVAPSQIVLPPQSQGSRTNTIKIMANTGKALNLSNPEYCCEKGVTVELNTVQPGRVYDLVAIFPEGFQVGTNQSSQLTVKTDNPSRPLVVVPVNQYHPRPQRAKPMGLNPPPPVVPTVQVAQHP